MIIHICQKYTHDFIYINYYFNYYRADYWKSQAKKYCEFCKCWLADNKPSIEFHEKGRKHQDNVARKLRTITRQSRRDQKEQIKVDVALQRMESAALEAYRKDIETNADISSRALNEKLQKENLALSSKKIWHEVKPSDGPSYYWNTETNESVWEPPSCGYLSLAEQDSESFNSAKKQLQAAEKFRKVQDKINLEKSKQRDEEDRAAAEREKMKARRIKEEEPEPVATGPILEPSYGPYGQWKTVEPKPTRKIDLQLPKQEEYIAIAIPTEKPEPPSKQFKEKTIASLADEEESACASTSFKKRKFPLSQKRNVRKRTDNN